MKEVRHSADFWSGLLFLAAGAGFLYLARNYSFGTPLRMGPSFFPVVLSVILALIGVITIVRAFAEPGEPVEAFTAKGIVAITAGAVLFGVLLHGAGLLIAVTVMTLVTAYASTKFRWRTALVMAAVLSAFCAVVFVYGLGLPMPILGSWFVG